MKLPETLSVTYANVVPYIGTWIETLTLNRVEQVLLVVPYIGTWIETEEKNKITTIKSRTLYRYVD